MAQNELIEELLSSAEYSTGSDGKRRIILDAEEFERLLAEFQAELLEDSRLLEKAIEEDIEFTDYEEIRTRLKSQGRL